MVNTLVASTIERFEMFKTKNGRAGCCVYRAGSDGTYREVKVVQTIYECSFKTLQMHTLTNRNNLEDRFEENSRNVLQLLNTVLNPNLFPRDSLTINYDVIGDVYNKDAEVNYNIIQKATAARCFVCQLVMITVKIFPDFAARAKIKQILPYHICGMWAKILFAKSTQT